MNKSTDSEKIVKKRASPTSTRRRPVSQLKSGRFSNLIQGNIISDKYKIID